MWKLGVGTRSRADRCWSRLGVIFLFFLDHIVCASDVHVVLSFAPQTSIGRHSEIFRFAVLQASLASCARLDCATRRSWEPGNVHTPSSAICTKVCVLRGHLPRTSRNSCTTQQHPPRTALRRAQPCSGPRLIGLLNWGNAAGHARDIPTRRQASCHHFIAFTFVCCFFSCTKTVRGAHWGGILLVQSGASCAHCPYCVGDFVPFPLVFCPTLLPAAFAPAYAPAHPCQGDRRAPACHAVRRCARRRRSPTGHCCRLQMTRTGEEDCECDTDPVLADGGHIDNHAPAGMAGNDVNQEVAAGILEEPQSVAATTARSVPAGVDFATMAQGLRDEAINDRPTPKVSSPSLVCVSSVCYSAETFLHAPHAAHTKH